MDEYGDAGPPPRRPEPASAGLRFTLTVLAALIAVLLVVLIIVLVTRDDGTGVVAADTSTTQAPPSTAPATTAVPTTAAATTTTTTQPTTVDLPDAASIYNQPVDNAVILLTEAGLTVETAGIGCSNSTEPGDVRRVTVGSQQDVRIIYGKPTDTIDQAAADGLDPGDEVTVWTPSSKPCP